MKKIILSLLLAVSSLVHASQTKTVQVIWPFAPGSTQAVMIRNLLENANANQKEYQFVFVTRPGAGGSIAANSILNSETLSILASTSSFYTRPLMYKESHDVDKFSMISQICENAPVGILSKKYKSLNEMIGKEVTFGIIPGSITQIFSNALAKNVKDIKVLEVPYKDTVASSADMMGRHVDVSVDLISVGTLAKMTPDVNLVAVSGTQKISDSNPIKELSGLTNNYWFFAAKSLDLKTQKDLNGILTAAINKKIKDDCLAEHGTTNLVPYDKLDAVHETNKRIWKNMTQGITVQ